MRLNNNMRFTTVFSIAKKYADTPNKHGHDREIEWMS